MPVVWGGEGTINVQKSVPCAITVCNGLIRVILFATAETTGETIYLTMIIISLQLFLDFYSEHTWLLYRDLASPAFFKYLIIAIVFLFSSKRFYILYVQPPRVR